MWILVKSFLSGADSLPIRSSLRAVAGRPRIRKNTHRTSENAHRASLPFIINYPLNKSWAADIKRRARRPVLQPFETAAHGGSSTKTNRLLKSRTSSGFIENRKTSTQLEQAEVQSFSHCSSNYWSLILCTDSKIQSSAEITIDCLVFYFLLPLKGSRLGRLPTDQRPGRGVQWMFQEQSLKIKRAREPLGRWEPSACVSVLKHLAGQIMGRRSSQPEQGEALSTGRQLWEELVMAGRHHSVQGFRSLNRRRTRQTKILSLHFTPIIYFLPYDDPAVAVLLKGSPYKLRLQQIDVDKTYFLKGLSSY